MEKTGLILSSDNNSDPITSMKCENQSDYEWYLEYLEPHDSMIRKWLEAKYGDYCDVDDVMQESYLRVFKARSEKELKSPKSFFYSVARNVAVSYIRASKVRVADSIFDDSVTEIIDDEACIEEETALNHELEVLTRAIQALPERCRHAFTLSKVYGMPHKDIAREMGISEHTVAAQLAIGLSKCTDFMNRYGKD